MAPIRVLNCAGSDPSAHICIRTPLAATSDVQMREGDPRAVRPADLDWADVVVFCRNSRAISRRVARAAALLGKPTIYELDDALLSPGLPEDRWLGAAAIRDMAVRLLNCQGFATEVTRFHAYRPLIAAAAREFRDDTHTPPTYFDTRLAPPAVSTGPRPTGSRVLLATDRLDLPATAQFIADMSTALLRARPEMQLHTWRVLPGLERHPRVHLQRRTADYPSYVQTLADLHATAGLAPLGRSLWEDCKSNAKYRDYCGVGLPGVYSPTPVYGCVTNGQTGLVAGNDPAAWVAAVSRLLDDEVLWYRIRAAAAADVRTRYRLADSVAFWTESLAAVRSAAVRRPPRRSGGRALAVVPSPLNSDGAGYRDAVTRIAAEALLDAREVRVHQVLGPTDLAAALADPDPAKLVLDASGAAVGLQEEVAHIAARAGAWADRPWILLDEGPDQGWFPELAEHRSRFTAEVAHPAAARVYLCQATRPGTLVGRIWPAAIGMAIRSAAAPGTPGDPGHRIAN